MLATNVVAVVVESDAVVASVFVVLVVNIEVWTSLAVVASVFVVLVVKIED
jgi:hypothetical protein